MTDTYCERHNIEKEVIGGCSAHRDNWYCVECDKEKHTNGNTEVIMTKDDEIGILLIHEMLECGTDVDIVFSDSQYKKVVNAFNNLIKENEQMKQDLVEIRNFLANNNPNTLYLNIESALQIASNYK